MKTKKRVKTTTVHRKKKAKKEGSNLWLLAIIPVILGIFMFFNHTSITISSEDSGKPNLLPVNTEFALPAEINLNVPFTIQAPHQNWVMPYKEFCEEASVLMAASYITGQDIPNPDFADAKMKEIQNYEIDRFGYYEDTTAEETATILNDNYNLETVELIYNPSIDDIKTALSKDQVVIVPAAGRQLGNPYFSGLGPLYHMLVIKGYTKDDKFITNDPGTRRGADYIYDFDVIMNAMHDWNNGDVTNGQKVIIVVG
jgi:hypothetical protein